MAKVEENSILEDLKSLTSEQRIIRLKAAKQFVESGKHLDVLKKALADNTSTSFTLPVILDERDYKWNEFGLEADNTEIPYCGCDKYCNEISWEDVQEYFTWTMLDKYITYEISSGDTLKHQYEHIMSNIAVMDWASMIVLCRHILKKIEKRMNGKVLSAYVNYVYVPNASMLAAEANRMSKSDKKDIFDLDEAGLIINNKDLNGIAKYHSTIINGYGKRIQFGLDVYTNKIVFDVVDKEEKQQMLDLIKHCLKNKKTVKDIFDTLRKSETIQTTKAEASPISLSRKEAVVATSAQDVIQTLASENNNVIVIQNILERQLKPCAQQSLIGVSSKKLPDYVMQAVGLYCNSHKNRIVVINDFVVDINELIKYIDGSSINTIKFNDCTLMNYNKLKESNLEISENRCIHSK